MIFQDPDSVFQVQKPLGRDVVWQITVLTFVERFDDIISVSFFNKGSVQW